VAGEEKSNDHAELTNQTQKKEGDQTVDSPSDVYYEYRCHSISFMEWLTSLGQGADILGAAWN